MLAGVMKKVHLRHFSYREDAACGQSYPTLLTDDRDRADVRKVSPHRHGGSGEGRIRLTRAGVVGRPPAGQAGFQRYCATAPRSAVAPAE